MLATLRYPSVQIKFHFWIVFCDIMFSATLQPSFSSGRLWSFFLESLLLSTPQYGFDQGRSTETAFLTQKEIILEAFENKEICIGIFVDFS